MRESLHDNNLNNRGKIYFSTRCLLISTPTTYFRVEGISVRGRSDGPSRQTRTEESDQKNRGGRSETRNCEQAVKDKESTKK
jgi:hypothetical protein